MSTRFAACEAGHPHTAPQPRYFAATGLRSPSKNAAMGRTFRACDDQTADEATPASIGSQPSRDAYFT
jgi:hypothetical protein